MDCASVSLPFVRPRRFQPLVLVSALLIAVICVALYGLFPYSQGYNDARVSVMTFAYHMWSLEDWNYCYIVPFIVCVIVYLDRERLFPLRAEGVWLGLPIIAVAAFVYWFGYEADIIYFGYASAQLMAAGLILYFLGWRWMLGLAFAWMFAAFMWPLLFLTDTISFPLRMIMSKASVMVLNIVGVPCLLDGTAIRSASDALTHRPVGALFNVDVAYACSGIRSLFALMMVSAVWAHFAVDGPIRKWIIFLSSMPLAVLGNLVRILILTFGTIGLGSEIAIGANDHPSAFHEGAGYVIFAVALVGLMGMTKLVNLDWNSLVDKFRHLSGPSGPRSADLPPPPGAKGGAKRIQDVY